MTIAPGHDEEASVGPPMRRALAGWAVDLIHDGLPRQALHQQGGGKAVWRALRSTAMSACQRGWDQWEWEALVDAPSSNLGRQVKTRDGVKPRPASAVRRSLDTAWESATAWVSQHPAYSAADVEAIASAMTAAVEDPTAPLDDAERQVLAYAVDETKRRGLVTPVVTWRAVQEATGLRQRTIQTRLRRLDERGLLRIVQPGRPGSPTATGPRAARGTLRRLPDVDDLDAYLYRETRSMGPPDKNYGTPGSESAGTHSKNYGTPPVAIPVHPDDEAAVRDLLASRAQARLKERQLLTSEEVLQRSANDGIGGRPKRPAARIKESA